MASIGSIHAHQERLREDGTLDWQRVAQAYLLDEHILGECDPDHCLHCIADEAATRQDTKDEHTRMEGLVYLWLFAAGAVVAFLALMSLLRGA